jgi:hypothetical protein
LRAKTFIVFQYTDLTFIGKLVIEREVRKMKLKSKLLGVALGAALLTSAGTYSSAQASVNNTDYEKKIVVVEDQDVVQPHRLRALWQGAKAIGSAAKRAYDEGISAADKVGMWLIGGVEEKSNTSNAEEMEVIFDQ